MTVNFSSLTNRERYMTWLHNKLNDINDADLEFFATENKQRIHCPECLLTILLEYSIVR